MKNLLTNISKCATPKTTLSSRVDHIQKCGNTSELTSLLKVYGKLPVPLAPNSGTTFRKGKLVDSDEIKLVPWEQMNESGNVLAEQNTLLGETSLSALVSAKTQGLVNPTSIATYKLPKRDLKSLN